MASAELLKITHSMGDRVMGAEGQMQVISDDLQNVCDDVQGVGKDISIRVQGVDNMLHQANRSLFLQLIILTAQTASQGTSLETTFYDGYRPQIPLSIIILHAKFITTVQLNGFSGAAHSVNGNLPAPSCGYTENVRCIWSSPCVNP